jgi:hypothetical protein
MNYKKYLVFFISIFFSNTIFAYECKTICKTPLIIKNSTNFSVIQILNKDTNLDLNTLDSIIIQKNDLKELNNRFCYKNRNYNIFIRVTTKDYFNGYVPINDIGIDNQEILPEYITDFEWIPEYEVKVLYSKEQKNLENYVEFYREYDKWKKYTDWENDTWYDIHSTPTFSLSNFAIIIEDMGYWNGRVEGIVNKVSSNEIDWVCIKSGSEYAGPKINDNIIEKLKKDSAYIFTYKIDGDYLYLYTNGKFFISLVNISSSLFLRIRDFYLSDKKNIDLSDITWPRHADGTCDYDGSAKPASTKGVPPAPSSSSIPVSGTTKRVTTNLRLRSTEDTSSTVITTMQKGTVVKIIKAGSQDTIDGIASNWVQVEVQSGSKDRNGKSITAGTTGWCFGGYLE